MQAITYYNKENNMHYIPNDFDWVIYNKLNAKLGFTTEKQARVHYLNIGRTERRQYKH